jgi:hypothetical protein
MAPLSMPTLIATRALPASSHVMDAIDARIAIAAEKLPRARCRATSSSASPSDYGASAEDECTMAESTSARVSLDVAGHYPGRRRSGMCVKASGRS